MIAGIRLAETEMTVLAVFRREIRPSKDLKLVSDQCVGYENNSGNEESLKVVSLSPELGLEVAFGGSIVVGRITKLEAINLKTGKFSSNSAVGARNVRV